MNRPFTRAMIIKLRRTHELPSHSERLRARGLLTQPEIEQLGVHSNTIHAWRRAGLLRAHKAIVKNDYLYEPQHPATHDSDPNRDDGSPTENQPHQPKELQCETNSVSYASPTEPTDASTW